MQLDAYQNSNSNADSPEFITVDPENEFSIDLNDPESIRKFVWMLRNDIEMFSNYYSISSGKGPTTSTAGISNMDQICTTCAMTYLD